MKHSSNNGNFERPLRPCVRRHQGGFTLVEIMIVVLILGVLMNIAMPAMIHARDTGQAKSCVANLRHITGAKEEYALDNRMATGQAVTPANLATYIRGAMPTCPTHSSATGYTYAINPVGTPPLCPYGAPASDPKLTHVYNF